MKKKLLTFTLAIIVIFTMSGTAFADLPIKPIDDPWNNPENLEADGNIYFAYNEAGYVVAWATPECDVDGEYKLLKNHTSVLVENRVKYMNNVPWGSTTITVIDPDTGDISEFKGWILMTDLYCKDGTPAYVSPAVIPEHPMIENPIPVPTEEPDPESTPQPTATPAPTAPQRPEEAITISHTYNNAIVYTSAAIAVVALALVAYVLIKHKALNKKGE